MGNYPLEGALTGSAQFGPRTGGSASGEGFFEVTLHPDVETAALADGDRYTLRVEGTNEVLIAAEKTVSYESSLPNGPSCDPYPCRTVGVELP